MTIDQIAQKIADVINEAQADGFDVEWDEGGLWITRTVPSPPHTLGGITFTHQLESRHVREYYWKSEHPWTVAE